MQRFADLHTHILYDVDDGAKTLAEMCAMLDAAYAGGTRILCATPHYHPGLFADTYAKSQAAFERLKTYAERYPDLTLYLGNELRCDQSCAAWLKSGDCRTLAGGKHVLVDFVRAASEGQIVNGLKSLLNVGYCPILAHAELYPSLRISTVARLAEDGVLIQMDAASPLGAFGLRAKLRARRLLKQGLVFIAASDMHDLNARPPSVRTAYEWMVKYSGKHYADRLFYENALHLLAGGEETIK